MELIIKKIAIFFKTVVAHEERFKKAFLALNKNSECSLKICLLTTISNIVKFNTTYRIKVRIKAYYAVLLLLLEF